MADLDAEAKAFAAAREVCRRDWTDLYFASHFLPKGKRRGVWAVAAMLGLVRDALVVEGETTPSTLGGGGCCSGSGMEGRLAMVRERVDRIYAGEWCPAGDSDEGQLAIRAAGMTIQNTGVPRAWWERVIEGRRMELTIRRYATWASVERMLGNVGGAAATILAGVVGVTSSEAGREMEELGKAAAWTGMLRNVNGDWERGLVRIPLEDLVRFGVREKELGGGGEKVGALMRFEVKRGEGMYEAGARGLRWLAGDGSTLAGGIVVATGRGLLRSLGRRPAGATLRDRVMAVSSGWGMARS